MQTITTATGHVHEVLFCGVGGILGELVFDMKDDRKAGAIIEEFDSPENTNIITYSDERNAVLYQGFTRLAAYSARPDGFVRIRLAKEAADNV